MFTWEFIAVGEHPFYALARKLQNLTDVCETLWKAPLGEKYQCFFPRNLDAFIVIAIK